MTSCTVSLSKPPVVTVQCLTVTAVQRERDPQFFSVITAELKPVMSTTDEKWFFRNLGGRKWMKLSGEQRSKLF
ncbi:conserved hypothetical protein [Escherichia coli]|mgnify:CR=1 FL=1|nr:hypothetical protein B1028_21090 [Escherichia coli]SOQ60294.1 conserved hypothetical protein [Escherichia coli]SOQ69103.1 conserved hypothetical protein [Escherichia coli]SOQ72716.1 conserved hypothetical protein [Escherichia coli]SOQ79948.1 conserved hypothetical protein [Escherichia coli]